MFSQNAAKVAKNEDAHVSCSLPGGGTGGEVCHLRLHLANPGSLSYDVDIQTGMTVFRLNNVIKMFDGQASSDHLGPLSGNVLPNDTDDVNHGSTPPS